MKFLFFVLFSLPVFSQSTCIHTPTQFSCVKYVKNYDGDTITFSIPGVHDYFGKKAKVRLQGVDAPEIKPKGQSSPCEKDWARVARKFVETQLKGAKTIHITKLNGRDKYGRILGQISYDGKDLKEALLKNYLAVPYEGKRKLIVNWCEMKKRLENKDEPKKL